MLHLVQQISYKYCLAMLDSHIHPTKGAKNIQILHSFFVQQESYFCESRWILGGHAFFRSFSLSFLSLRARSEWRLQEFYRKIYPVRITLLHFRQCTRKRNTPCHIGLKSYHLDLALEDQGINGDTKTSLSHMKWQNTHIGKP